LENIINRDDIWPKVGGILEEFYSAEDFPEELQYCTSQRFLRRQLVGDSCGMILSTTKQNRSKIMGNNAHFLEERPDIANFWFNQPRKLSLCAPHKVGSQTWRYFFQRLAASDTLGILKAVKIQFCC
jgi:hypothetical protein